jgi:AraC-like DNA-binding protein
MHVTRRTLFDGDLVQVVHAHARPSLPSEDDLQRQNVNVLVLPLEGAFSMHDGPRRHAIATPNHAVFVAASKPYRMSLLTEAGDQCLTLRFSAAAVARVAPKAMSGVGFDLSAFESCVPLPSAILLARSLLWQRFRRGDWDPLEVEEICASLLVTSLHAACKDGRAWRRAALGSRSTRRMRRVARVMEAVAQYPDRKWTLDALAGVAAVSPWHLAHEFREQAGTSVYQHVLRARLGKALDAVLETSADLSAVAHGAGFASHSHFTARFRAWFGTTPAELRRSASLSMAVQMRKIVTARAPAGS